MAQNFGKMTYKMIDIPAVMMPKQAKGDPDIMILPARKAGFQVTAKGRKLWADVSAKVETSATTWFIAVQPDGWIESAEQDPTLLAQADNGADFWVIDHPGGHDDIICHKWTGKEVVPWPVSPDR